MRSSVRAIAALTSVVAALAVLLLGHGTVSAHNTLLSSSPPDGSQLTESPTQIALQFDLPAPLETASAELIDATGVRTDLTDLFHGPAGETEIVAPLPAGLSGAVTVRWRLVGPDGHPLTGRVSFTVAMPTSTSPAAATSVPPVETSTTSPSLAASADDDSGDTTGTPGAVRWLLRFASYVAIGAVIGITLTDRLIWHGLASRPSFRRLISRSLAAVAALAFAQLLILGADIEGTSPWRAFGALDTATLTDAGVALSIRILLCAVAWVVLCEMDFVHAQVRWTALTLVGVALMGTWAWAGHARSQRWSWLGVPVDVVHHSAASLWVAALAIVGITALTALQPAELEPVMRRMSTIAAGAVIVIVATGSIQTLRVVGGPTQLLDAGHGRYLIAKLVLVAFMLGLANHHRTRLATIFRTEQPADLLATGLRRGILTEFALGVAVIGVTAAMVVSPPSSASAAASTTTAFVPTSSTGCFIDADASCEWTVPAIRSLA
jgi:copper transport protein